VTSTAGFFIAAPGQDAKTCGKPMISLYNLRFFKPASDRQSGQEAEQAAEVTIGYQTIEASMKEGIHPDYREVVFQDMSNDFKFITRSTIQTRETINFEGKEYPLVKIEVSAESHPFYTGKHKIVDTAGRVDKFRKKFGSVGSKTQVAE
jgi:large subunit ribosomal protein L31